ncbi:uncharacterized protein LOC132612859 [Lycium barbarum]|uniref:uncharacterized protein LOC132612859 n=1 Tax=Lycium barbarum TaxID=112863 RepID=UPI00293E31FC|nr:uncharacterized protein LOC132612859 [Lycium barbarum]
MGKYKIFYNADFKSYDITGRHSGSEVWFDRIKCNRHLMRKVTISIYMFPFTKGDYDDEHDFECNICFELAQDPIVTLCGHLYCWPCLYRWLRLHSQCHECPVCKALIQEEKLVPLYGRGRTSTDPRSKPILGLEIPNRPAGQRPETAPQPDPNNFHNHRGFGHMGGLGGFFPTATARSGNFTMSAGFGGLVPSLLIFQFHGFLGPTAYPTTSNYPFGYTPAYHGPHVCNAQDTAQVQADSNLKFMFLLVGFLVLIYLLG